MNGIFLKSPIVRIPNTIASTILPDLRLIIVPIALRITNPISRIDKLKDRTNGILNIRLKIIKIPIVITTFNNFFIR